MRTILSLLKNLKTLVSPLIIIFIHVALLRNLESFSAEVNLLLVSLLQIYSDLKFQSDYYFGAKLLLFSNDLIFCTKNVNLNNFKLEMSKFYDAFNFGSYDSLALFNIYDLQHYLNQLKPDDKSPVNSFIAYLSSATQFASLQVVKNDYFNMAPWMMFELLKFDNVIKVTAFKNFLVKFFTIVGILFNFYFFYFRIYLLFRVQFSGFIFEC